MKLDTFLYIIGLVALAISAILAWFWIFAEDGIIVENEALMRNEVLDVLQSL
jgi:hypothetical protein